MPTRVHRLQHNRLTMDSKSGNHLCYNIPTDPFTLVQLPITMADPAPPVILLAYANPNLRGYDPLDRLVDEARDLRAILQPAARAGRCELVEIPNATLTEVLDAFQDPHTRRRIAVFHFAGHGQGDSLLLEERTGVPLLADAGGIAAFLARQAGLRLVFLNACSTAEQAAGLHVAGAPAVVATDLDVPDEWAHAFAVRFYKGLVGGSSLMDALGEAEAGVYAQYGGNRAGEVWPWRLHLRGEEDGKWVLPARRVRPGGTVPLQRPLRTQHFIGREHELAKLLEDLQPGKTVTLCGPGGMGKSALAAEAIWRMAPGDDPPGRFPDGIIFHTFYHQPQAGLALEAIARAYGVDPRPSPRDAALQALAGKRALLVLDGAEAADDLVVVLAVTGTCGVLITTRRHEDAPDDSQDIEPLPHTESLDLLRAWAGRYASDEPAANDIVRLLGGLPLALFLAGRFLAQRKQRADEYAAWLHEQGLAALHFGERPSKSVPLLLSSSLAGVSKQAQAAFGVAGILALVPFDPDVIAAALDISPTAANRSLGELVDYGLLLRPDESYQVTHALAHSYAHAQIRADAETIARLTMYYAVLAQTESGRGLAGYAILDRQRAHIAAVQAAALQAEQWDAVRQITWKTRDYFDLKGYSTDRLTVIQAGLDAARAVGDSYDEGAFLTLLGLAYATLGENSRAIELYEQSLAIARKISNRREEGRALSNLGIAYKNLGEIRRAIELYEQHLTIAREIGDRHGEGNTRGHLGRAYHDLGETHRAIELYGQSLAIARECGNRREEGAALSNLGRAYATLGEPRRAIALYEQQLAITREIGDRRGEGIALGNLGVAYKNLGETRRAIELYEQHLTIAREIGDRRGEGAALGNLAKAYSVLGLWDAAVSTYVGAIEISKGQGYRYGEGVHRNNYASLLALRNAYSHAQDQAVAAVAIGKETANAQVGSESNSTLALIALLIEDINLASSALAAARRYPYPPNTAELYFLAGLLALCQEETLAATGAFIEGLAAADARLHGEQELYAALDLRALSRCGLALCVQESDNAAITHVQAAVADLRAARAVNSDLGTVAQLRLRFGLLAVHDPDHILAPVEAVLVQAAAQDAPPA